MGQASRVVYIIKTYVDIKYALSAISYHYQIVKALILKKKFKKCFTCYTFFTYLMTSVII